MKFELNFKEERILEHAKYIVSYVFQSLLFLFLITLLLQQFYPEKIKSMLNINWFMIFVIIFGVISIIFPPKPELKLIKKPNWKDYSLIIILGIIGCIIIFLKIKSIGIIGYIISILGGAIIILISYLILTEEGDNLTDKNSIPNQFKTIN